MAPILPRWSSRAFLVYAAGFTALVALESWYAWFASRWKDGAVVLAALVALLAAAVLAVGLRRIGRPVAAGVFASVALIAFVVFVGELWTWFGWMHATTSLGLRGFHVAQLALVLIWLLAALATLRSFRFPLLVLQAAGAGWLFVTDLISNGGSWSAVVSLVIGLVYLAMGLSVDSGQNRPYGFWLHVMAGLLIGGSLLWLWHGGDFEWTLIAIVSIVYILFADAVDRSSWAVLGAIGLLLASTHFTLEWTHVQLVFFNAGSSSTRAWVPPLVTTCTALVLLLLGIRSTRTAPSPV